MQIKCTYCGSSAVKLIQTIPDQNISHYSCGICSHTFVLADKPAGTAAGTAPPSSAAEGAPKSSANAKVQQSKNSGSSSDRSGNADNENAAPDEEVNYTSAKEFFTIVSNQLNNNYYLRACKLLDNYPHPEECPLRLLFYRNVAVLGDYGGIKSPLEDPNKCLSVLNDHVSHLNNFLATNDREKLYDILSGLYDAIKIFGQLRINPYSHSSYLERGRHSTIKVVIDEKTYAWLERTVIIGKMAQNLESLQNDSRYGAKYREMAASLWADCLYNPSLQPSGIGLNTDFVTVALNRTLDYFTVNKQENRLRQQIQNKLNNPQAVVDLSFNYVDRKKTRMTINLLVFCALLIIGCIAALFCPDLNRFLH